MVMFLRSHARREAEEERERDKIEKEKDGYNSVTDDYFKFLPEEIKLDILTRLPTESVLDSKLVCRNWRNIISHHPSFSKMQVYRLLNHPSSTAGADDDSGGKLEFIALNDDYEIQHLEFSENQSTTTLIERITMIKFTPCFDRRIIVVGSCNGLICLTRYLYCSVRHIFCTPERSNDITTEEELVCICNPINKEYVLLPQIKRDSSMQEDIKWIYGFGYVDSITEYKVVGFGMYDFQYMLVYVYTLGSGLGWRNLGKFGDYLFISGTPPLFFNEALYHYNIHCNSIVIFNLAEEKFCENLLPPPYPPEECTFWDCTENKLGVLDGFLLFAKYDLLHNVEGPCYDIWLLRKKNEKHHMKEQEVEHQSWVWTKEFSMGSLLHREQLLAVTQSDGVLCYMDEYLFVYDPKASTSKWFVDLKKRVIQVLTHKNTLVSLKELGEEDTKTIEPIQVEETIKSHDQSLKQLEDDEIPAHTLIYW